MNVLGFDKLYVSELMKRRVTDLVTQRLRRVRSPMQAIVAQLQAKRLFPERARALELFGMYGFWATMDYLPRVESLDFFEIDEARLHLSRRNLRSPKVTFHAADSMQFVATTDRRYDFIVADPPVTEGGFYDEKGLPVFYENLVRVAAPGAVIVAGVKAASLSSFGEVERAMLARAQDRPVADFFFEFASFDMYNWTVLVLDKAEVSDRSVP